MTLPSSKTTFFLLLLNSNRLCVCHISLRLSVCLELGVPWRVSLESTCSAKSARLLMKIRHEHKRVGVERSAVVLWVRFRARLKLVLCLQQSPHSSARLLSLSLTLLSILYNLNCRIAFFQCTFFLHCHAVAIIVQIAQSEIEREWNEAEWGDLRNFYTRFYFSCLRKKTFNGCGEISSMAWSWFLSLSNDLIACSEER